METNLVLSNWSFFSSSFEVLVLFIIIFLPMFISLNIKSQNNIPYLPLLSFAWYSLRGILGVAKYPICEIFMKMGSLVSLPYSTPMIAISNDYDAIKHMLNSPDEWTDRPKNVIFTFRANGHQDRGILTSSGEVWKDTRRYTIRTLAQLGLGKKSNLEYTTNEELKGLLKTTENLIEKTGNKVPIRSLFSLATINVIWRIIGGTAFSADDPDFIEIVEATDSLVEINFYQLIWGEYIGKFIFTVPGLIKCGTAYKAQETMRRHFSSVLQRHKKLLDNKNTPEENFTDNFIRQMEADNDGKKLEHVFNIENLIVTLFDLFEAGVDTTSSTLEFAVMHLIEHPQVQLKIQKEIKSVIGDREPSFYSDRNIMPFTQAVVYEVHRMASIVPLNFRTSVRDCYVNDVFIRKGTAAVVNLYSVHYDEKFWGDPYNFRPERFLTSEDVLDNSKVRRLLNFGAGKRVCIGESVANISVFTLLVGILQKYKIEKADPNEVLGLELNSSFTARAKPFHARFVSI